MDRSDGLETMRGQAKIKIYLMLDFTIKHAVIFVITF
jgi:hypothetical protein